MRTLWSTAAMSLAGAALVVGCGGTDGANRDRPAQSDAGQQAMAEPLILSGCVQTGQGATEFVLENVRFVDGRQAGAGSNDPAADRSTITEGSWVQLRASAAAEPAHYIGQEVRVAGRLVEAGGEVGTSGATGQHTTPSGDKSMAASDEPHWDKKQQEAGAIGQDTIAKGRAPEVHPDSIEPTGKQCQSQTQRRR